MDSDEMSLGVIERELNESENARKKELDAHYLMEKLFITLHLYNSYLLLVIFPWKNVTKKLSYLQTIIITSPYYFESADTFD